MFEPKIKMKMHAEGFRLLADQKRELLQLIENGTASDRMDGLVNLIDHIQDQCVDANGIEEKIVFPYKSED
jgi:hypothetical protein